MRSVQPSRSSVVSKLPATKCVVMHVLVLVACLLVGKSLYVSLAVSFIFPVMHSPGPAFQEYTRSCHENVPATKALTSVCNVNRWSDCIGYSIEIVR